MTIARMEKIQVLIHQDAKQRLIERIQELEQLHITDIRDGATAEDHPDVVPGSETSDEHLERRIAQIQSTLDFLASVSGKKGLLAGIVAPKIILTPEQYQDVAEGYDEGATVSHCRELDRERTELQSAITKLEGLAQQLSPWLALDCPVEEIAATEHTVMFLGALPVEALGDFDEKFSEIGDRVAVEKIGEDRERAYLLICLHRGALTEGWDLLKHLGFEEATFPDLRGKPADAYRITREEIEERLRRIQQIEERSREYVSERQKLQVLYDHLNAQLQQRRVEANIGQTQNVSIVEGWIPERALRSFEGQLTGEFDHLAIIRQDPSTGETPPVALENSKTFIRPFEVVTELYGLPNVREYDPSPLLAPFFFIFFGLCITDAAYGIIITLLFLFLMKKFRATLGRAKLVGLLFFGGISTIVMGALTGGWFGDLFDYLPSSLHALVRMRQSLMLFDPMEQVLVFIGIAIILGFGQICYGLAIRLARRVREGDLAGALCGPLPWLTLLNSLVMFGLSKGGIFSQAFGSVGKWGALFSALAIIFLSDRTSPSFLARVVWGIYGLYGITSYVGDVLSYLRLFALGLATGIIAMVVNLLADMLGGAPYIGWILFGIVFVIGHAFNILINGLGAFVHTLRLQYVEFFPKFFEGGGRPYRPFRREAKYTILAEDGQR